MDRLMQDPRFLDTTFVVIDFEALTPTGRAAEPVEVAALALRADGGRLVEIGRFEELIRPPADVPVTPMDTAQTGLTAAMLATAAPASAVMARLDAHLSAPPYRLVAHHAPTEAGLIAHQGDHCPVLAGTPLLDTVRMAKHVLPGLGSYRLDNLLGHYDIPKPPDRHRAMPDVEATRQVLGRLLTEGCASGRWRTLLELDMAAGLQPKRLTPAGSQAEQNSLF
ncbi:DNA polymerase-3 subunit epsilon [Kitasatospora sp. MAA19]|uniref:3'-5' exonuclease n=1 Tax=Kitasatospora sp. MAA19 TaxID=3035090 RepID=UPI002476250C|nr:3'-5' exonuclease [Kitasatospora sp. MAA19]MDH6710485.1 DNA polymerase-3 subunit epsilon [Kitasatospora sp. MAA19]